MDYPLKILKVYSLIAGLVSLNLVLFFLAVSFVKTYLSKLPKCRGFEQDPSPSSPGAAGGLTVFIERQAKMSRVFFDCQMPLAKAENLSGEGQWRPPPAFRHWPLEKNYKQFLKRLFDLFLSVIVILLILSWMAPLLAIIIRLGSKGPVFFIQLRSGKDGVPFKCYKFRTMYVNDMADRQQAQKNDSRFTRIGRFLRRTSIDEMPQFFNVIKNEMSVIGPRPHMLMHTEKYKRLLDNYMIRHYVKPGITGWAQVNGCRGETKKLEEMAMRIEHDVFYLKNWSFFWDLRIARKTIWILLRREKDVY